jgi:hypothetical protein
MHELNVNGNDNGTYVHWEVGPRPPWPMHMVPRDSTIACYRVWNWRVWGGNMVVVQELNLPVTKPHSVVVSSKSQKPCDRD